VIFVVFNSLVFLLIFILLCIPALYFENATCTLWHCNIILSREKCTSYSVVSKTCMYFCRWRRNVPLGANDLGVLLLSAKPGHLGLTRWYIAVEMPTDLHVNLHHHPHGNNSQCRCKRRCQVSRPRVWKTNRSNRTSDTYTHSPVERPTRLTIRQRDIHKPDICCDLLAKKSADYVTALRRRRIVRSISIAKCHDERCTQVQPRLHVTTRFSDCLRREKKRLLRSSQEHGCFDNEATATNRSFGCFCSLSKAWSLR